MNSLRIFIVFFCLWLGACQSASQKGEEIHHPNFETSDASVLFFKNVRQLYYQLETQPDTKMRLYRLKNALGTNLEKTLFPVIAHNWRYDEAYLILESKTFAKSRQPLVLDWKDPITQKSGQFTFKFGNKEEHFRFASSVYRQIEQDRQITLQQGEESLPFLQNQQERMAFEKVMKDYYRLVGIL